jgi:hydroxymethylbilane synthase
VSCSADLTVSVGARSSLLSRAQVQEVLLELRRFHPEAAFKPIWIETTGDLDLKTSLRFLDKTDFFTREIDALLFSQSCRIAVHSAKDVPDPLPQGLVLIALTKGVDPSDSLAFRQSESLDTLPLGAKVGTSSLRRESNVRLLRRDLVCVDIRGSIDSRLAQLDAGMVDALVVAEAALIRLGLTHRSRITLPGSSAPFQGQLAIVAREGDEEMRSLFAPLDCR